MEINNMKALEQLKCEFTRLVVHRYRMHCKRTGEQETLEGMVAYIVRRDVIRQRTLARYMVMDLYPRAMYETNGKKQPALEIVADQTGLGERTIRNMVAHPPDFSDKEAS